MPLAQPQRRRRGQITRSRLHDTFPGVQTSEWARGQDRRPSRSAARRARDRAESVTSENLNLIMISHGATVGPGGPGVTRDPA